MLHFQLVGNIVRSQLASINLKFRIKVVGLHHGEEMRTMSFLNTSS